MSVAVVVADHTTDLDHMHLSADIVILLVDLRRMMRRHLLLPPGSGCRLLLLYLVLSRLLRCHAFVE